MPIYYPTDRNPNSSETLTLLLKCHDNRDKIIEWNDYRKANPDWVPDISDAERTGRLSSKVFCYKDDDGSCHGINLSKAKLGSVNFIEANLSRVQFDDAFLGNARFDKAMLIQATFVKSDMTSAKFAHANLSRANMSFTILKYADLVQSILERANFEGSNLEKVNMMGAKLGHANLSGAILNGVNLTQADLTNADLRNCEVDGTTTFHPSVTRNCRIDRDLLDSLNPSNRTSIADERKMKIEDPIALLRQTYSGFWMWFHLLALTIFIAPYAWFLINRWVVAQFKIVDGQESITLLECLVRFIWSGGVSWKDGWHFNFWPFTAFVLSIAYNAFRLFMLWKTKTLELMQQTTNQPAMYTHTRRRLWLNEAAKWAMYVNLIVIIYHSIHFLMQRVSTG